MNRKLVPVLAVFLVLVALFGSTPLSYALVPTFGPKLEVWTIPQDDQKRDKGIVILGLDGIHPTCTTDSTKATTTVPLCGPQDLMSQHKLLVTWNGLPLTWVQGTVGVNIVCNVLEKDKVNVVPDPKTGTGKQGSWENLMTNLVDVSDKFICKPRWKSPTPGLLESVGVLDVYYVGPYDGHWIADNILVVEAFITVGRTVVWGSDIQDICVLGFGGDPKYTLTKPDGTKHYIWRNALNPYVSCEDVALLQRDWLGIPLEKGQDPLA